MTPKQVGMVGLFALTFGLPGPPPAAAVDGVVEINQARALAGGVTASDGAGFPVTIDTSGSYRLTGNLSVPLDKHGIEVTAEDVTLDLNGFSIAGVQSQTCGLNLSAESPRGVKGGNRLHVRNGRIRYFCQAVAAGSAAHVESLHVEQPYYFGISTGADSLVADSIVEDADIGNYFSGGSAIEVGTAGIVRGCNVVSNGGHGIGISGYGHTILVSGNTVLGCLLGIKVGDASTVVGNISTANTIYGVEVGAGSTVLDNTIRSNGAFGIGFSVGPSGFARNVLSNNHGGDNQPQVGLGSFGGGSGIEIGTNICGTDTVCP